MKKLILIALLVLCITPVACAAEEINANTTIEFTKNPFWPYEDSFNFRGIARADQNFNVYVQINNTGTSNATNVSIALIGTIDPTWITSTTNTSKETLAPAETLQSIFTLKVPQLGAYDITALISASNANQKNLTRVLNIVNQTQLLVKVGKSANMLSYNISSQGNTRKGTQSPINITLKNTGSTEIKELAFEVIGVDTNYIVELPAITNLAPGSETTTSISLNIGSTGDYNIDLRGTAWYDVSVDNGSTSYDAFSKVANIDGAWNGWPLNAYLINDLDGVASDWSKGWSWSYYKNDAYSDCGVGCTGGWGCPQGDMLKDGDKIEFRYNNYGADWMTWPPVQVPMQTVQINVSEPAPPPPPPPASSGGGGGGSSTAGGALLPQESAKFGNMNAGTNLVVPLEKSGELGITDVKLEVNEIVRNAVVKVMKYNVKPAGVTDPTPEGGATSAFLSIEKLNFKDEALGKASIGFKLEKSWLDKNNLNEDTVALQRYSSKEWQRLPTAKESSTPSYVYYRAETPGFSIFAITAEKRIEKITEAEKEPATAKEEPLVESKENIEEAQKTDEKESAPTGFTVLRKAGSMDALLVLLLAIGLLAGLIYKERLLRKL